MSIEDLAKRLREQAGYLLFDEEPKPTWEYLSKPNRKASIEHAKEVAEILSDRTEGASP